MLYLLLSTFFMQQLTNRKYYVILKNFDEYYLEYCIKSGYNQFHLPIFGTKNGFNSIVPSIRFYYII